MYSKIILILLGIFPLSTQ
ncbi:hypothetical protein Gotri_023724 [Gossypium trilobum]|uniref:Uncharacterized protein n=1 Tax=Gossypium trilobum TaxID=34281 RepID=A0A7J9DJV2_9ROSI|nr:hypothetical protein [Gossypium trilobum]